MNIFRSVASSLYGGIDAINSVLFSSEETLESSLLLQDVEPLERKETSTPKKVSETTEKITKEMNSQKADVELNKPYRVTKEETKRELERSIAVAKRLDEQVKLSKMEDTKENKAVGEQIEAFISKYLHGKNIQRASTVFNDLNADIGPPFTQKPITQLELENHQE